MIFLDVDGVLVDFCSAAQRAIGVPVGPVHTWNWFEDYGLTEPEFWARIELFGEDFYSRMVKPYPWAEEVLELCQRADATVLLTACARHPHSWSGKKIIADRVAPGVPVVMTKHKELLAREGAVLIDDKEENVDRFRDAGGQAILFPQPWNSAGPDVEKPADWLRREWANLRTPFAVR